MFAYITDVADCGSKNCFNAEIAAPLLDNPGKLNYAFPHLHKDAVVNNIEAFYL